MNSIQYKYGYQNDVSSDWPWIVVGTEIFTFGSKICSQRVGENVLLVGIWCVQAGLFRVTMDTLSRVSLHCYCCVIVAYVLI